MLSSVIEYLNAVYSFGYFPHACHDIAFGFRLRAISTPSTSQAVRVPTRRLVCLFFLILFDVREILVFLIGVLSSFCWCILS